MNANEFFVMVWNAIGTVVNYSESWKNGTGYLDNGVNVPVLKGEMVKFTDEYDRKGILIGTRFGTVVVFQRFSDSAETSIVFNIPKSKAIKALMGKDGPLSLEKLEEVTGAYVVSNRVCSHGTNIGATIEAIAKDFE